jgi:hypothetical protein
MLLRSEGLAWIHTGSACGHSACSTPSSRQVDRAARRETAAAAVGEGSDFVRDLLYLVLLQASACWSQLLGPPQVPGSDPAEPAGNSGMQTAAAFEDALFCCQ